MDPAEVKEVANKRWSEVGVIDRYIKKNSELQAEHKKIIQGWKRRIQGKFFMKRMFKDVYMAAKKSGQIHRFL